MVQAAAAGAAGTAAAQLFEDLATVGMAVEWSGCRDLLAYERRVYSGKPASLVHDAGAASRMQPKAAGEALFSVAGAALDDGGFDAERWRLRIAVLFACWAPVEFSCPWAEKVVDLSGSQNPLVDALLAAPDLLARQGFDAVVYVAASGRPEVGETASLDLPAAGKDAFGFDAEVHGWRFGAGAGAVAWMDARRAAREKRRVYALVRAAAFAAGSKQAGQIPIPPSLEDVRSCCRAALQTAGCTAGQVGFLGAFASGVDALDGIEIAGTVQVYRQSEQDLCTAMGSAQANTGCLDAAAGLAGFVQAALCLYQRIYPAAPGWTAPKLPALWRGAPFFVPGSSRTWFQRSDGPARLAALNVIGLGGSFAHFVLSEGDHPEGYPRHGMPRGRLLAGQETTLLPLTFESVNGLMDRLEALRDELVYETGLPALAERLCREAAENQEAPFAASFVARDLEELAREIELAQKASPGAFEKGGEWQTPLGSYLTAAPAGREGGVALVYPGAFNTYPGVAQDLFYLFPELHERAAEVTPDIGGALNERMVYPRQLAAVTKEEMAEVEARLLADPIAMLTSGTALTILYTHILEKVFGIRSSAAFGYSLGENSMMYATGVWAQGEQAAQRLAQADVFRVRLAGPRLAIRESWGLTGSGEESGAPLWSNYLVMAPPAKVQEAMQNEPHVYLTHINTPRQVVIGGDPQACHRVLSAVRASSLQAPFDYALHCAPMRSEYSALAELHYWPVEKKPALRMYSAADYDVLRYESGELADKMAHMLTTPLDFPRLIQRVYADGARVFIEAGAGSNCARWISETLKGSTHLAISMDRRGSDDASTLVRTAARLFSHRVPMDLSALYIPGAEKVNL